MTCLFRLRRSRFLICCSAEDFPPKRSLDLLSCDGFF
jgi:hypothetical protein